MLRKKVVYFIIEMYVFEYHNMSEIGILILANYISHADIEIEVFK